MNGRWKPHFSWEPAVVCAWSFPLPSVACTQDGFVLETGLDALLASLAGEDQEFGGAVAD